MLCPSSCNFVLVQWNTARHGASVQWVLYVIAHLGKTIIIPGNNVYNFTVCYFPFPPSVITWSWKYLAKSCEEDKSSVFVAEFCQADVLFPFSPQAVSERLSQWVHYSPTIEPISESKSSFPAHSLAVTNSMTKPADWKSTWGVTQVFTGMTCTRGGTWSIGCGKWTSLCWRNWKSGRVTLIIWSQWKHLILGLLGEGIHWIKLLYTK